MKNTVWLALLLIVAAGCKKSTAPIEGAISIDVREKPLPIQDAGIIKNYEIIPLETADDILVDKIDKIILHEGLIYIANYRQSANVMIFDSRGKFVREIRRQGRGPLEYMQFRNMFIDQVDNTFNIVDSYPAKILKFPLDGSGNPEVINIPGISVDDVVSYSGGYICYTTFSSQNDGRTLSFLDRKGERTGEDIRMRDGWESNGFSSAHVFSKFRDKTYFKPVYESPIYQYDNRGKFETAAVLDFGPHNWPKEIRTADDFMNKNQFSAAAGDYVGYINNYQEKEDYWLLLYMYRGATTFTVYDKAAGKSIQYMPDANTEKYFIGFGTVASVTEDHIITWLDAVSLAGMLENKEMEKEYPQQFERLRQKVGDIKANDNQVLIIYDI